MSESAQPGMMERAREWLNLRSQVGAPYEDWVNCVVDFACAELERAAQLAYDIQRKEGRSDIGNAIRDQMKDVTP